MRMRKRVEATRNVRHDPLVKGEPPFRPAFPPSIPHDFMLLPKAHLQAISRAPRNFKKTKMSNATATGRQSEHLQQTAQRQDPTPSRSLQSPLKRNCISKTNARFLWNYSEFISFGTSHCLMCQPSPVVVWFIIYHFSKVATARKSQPEGMKERRERETLHLRKSKAHKRVEGKSEPRREQEEDEGSEVVPAKHNKQFPSQASIEKGCLCTGS